jgi:hypothetical protein
VPISTEPELGTQADVDRENRRVATVEKTTIRPIDQANDHQGSLPAGNPLYIERAALVTTVNGLASATTSSHPGIVEGSTKAEDTKVKGNIQMNPAELAASTDETASPMTAWTQLSA